VNASAAPATICTRCREEIDICAGCDEPGCRASLCYACMNALVRPPAPPSGDDA